MDERDTDIESAVQACIIVCRTKGVRAASMIYCPMIIRIARAIILDQPQLAESEKQQADVDKYNEFISTDRDGFADLFEKQLSDLLKSAPPRSGGAEAPTPAPERQRKPAGTPARSRASRASRNETQNEF